MSAHPETRGDILARFHAMVARGEPIIGGGAGTGLSAKCEEAGGIDLSVIYNSGRFRMAGRGRAHSPVFPAGGRRRRPREAPARHTFPGWATMEEKASGRQTLGGGPACQPRSPRLPARSNPLTPSARGPRAPRGVPA